MYFYIVIWYHSLSYKWCNSTNGLTNAYTNGSIFHEIQFYTIALFNERPHRNKLTSTNTYTCMYVCIFVSKLFCCEIYMQVFTARINPFLRVSLVYFWGTEPWISYLCWVLYREDTRPTSKAINWVKHSIVVKTFKAICQCACCPFVGMSAD